MLNWLVVMAFMTVTGLAAARLLLLWRETRELPELLIATLILGVGTLGVGGSFVIAQLVPEGSLQTVLSFIPTTAVTIGMSSLCVFTWLVYRPTSTLARSAAAALASPLVLLQLYAASQGNILVVAEGRLSIVSSIIYTAAMMWSATEAMIYWRLMRRRVRLGLADLLVTNRFLLWGIATGAAGVGIAIGAVARIVFGIGGQGDLGSWVLLSYAAHGTVSAVAFWLAFKPPGLYVRWVRSGRVATAQAP